jgi:hypothetical protein
MTAIGQSPMISDHLRVVLNSWKRNSALAGSRSAQLDKVGLFADERREITEILEKLL